MMIRIQLHLTEQQDRRLRSLARRRGTTRADLIREGIGLVLQGAWSVADPLLELVGAAGPAGRRDGAARHDEVIYPQPGDRGR